MARVQPHVQSAPTSVSARLADVRRRIAAAAERSGRSQDPITLLVVSKGFGADAVDAARRAGQQEFAESRAQELVRKAREVEGSVGWQFVGRLQRNKVSDVVGLVTMIHSVDRLELAKTVASRATRAELVQPVLVQVNVGHDPAKGGCRPADVGDLVAHIQELDGVVCHGLMTVPPMGEDPRPLFARLRQLRDDLRGRFPEVAHLSMGMSADFETAIEEGATIVRLGEAVFGPRPAARRGGGPARTMPDGVQATRTPA